MSKPWIGTLNVTLSAVRPHCWHRQQYYQNIIYRFWATRMKSTYCHLMSVMRSWNTCGFKKDQGIKCLSHHIHHTVDHSDRLGVFLKKWQWNQFVNEHGCRWSLILTSNAALDTMHWMSPEIVQHKQWCSLHINKTLANKFIINTLQVIVFKLRVGKIDKWTSFTTNQSMPMKLFASWLHFVYSSHCN